MSLTHSQASAPTTPSLEAALAELEAKTKRSQLMARDRTEAINAAMAASGHCPPPIFVERNAGAYFTDLDGNRFIDTCMGFGTAVLGHNPDLVQDAIKTQADKGWHYSLRGADQLAFARQIKKAASGNDRVVFCNSGTEATLYAIRAARALTGKQKIVKFDISYHGAHDAVLVWPSPESTESEMLRMPLGFGLASSAVTDTILLPFGNEACLTEIEKHADEIAAVLIEPVQGSLPDATQGPYLKALINHCRSIGVLTIVDEVLTGFRLAYGGAQEFFEFSGDLVTYGKAVGGGLPVGIISGREDLMRAFGDFTAPPGIFFGGTFSGNPLTVAAGLAVTRHLDNHREIYEDINAKTARLSGRFNRYCQARGLNVAIQSCGSLWQIFFKGHLLEGFGYDGREAEGAFYLHCLEQGLFIHATHRCFMSAAHDDDMVDQIGDILETSLERLAEDKFDLRCEAS